jgi:hypothetical protein
MHSSIMAGCEFLCVLQALPKSKEEIVQCGVEALRASWFAPYILRTIECVGFVQLDQPLESIPVYMFEGAWASCGAVSGFIHAVFLACSPPAPRSEANPAFGHTLCTRAVPETWKLRESIQEGNAVVKTELASQQKRGPLPASLQPPPKQLKSSQSPAEQPGTSRGQLLASQLFSAFSNGSGWKKRRSAHAT